MVTRESWTNFVKVLHIVVITLVALGGLFTSLYLFCTDMKSDIHVAAGRQARLYVLGNLEGCQNPQPLIIMSFVFTNNAGKTAPLFDTRLEVGLSEPSGAKRKMRFKAMRQYDHIPLTDYDDTQELIRPVAVLGRSSEVRVFGFTPEDCVNQKDIPRKFDLEMEVFTQWQGHWEPRSKYLLDNVTGVWQDLEGDSTYQAIVRDIHQVEQNHQ